MSGPSSPSSLGVHANHCSASTNSQRWSGGAEGRQLRWPLGQRTSVPVVITRMRSPAAKLACYSCVAQDQQDRQAAARSYRSQPHRQPDPAPADQEPHAGQHRADQQHQHRSETSIFRKLRGPTYVGIIADEMAFWFTNAEFANPDVEVLAAARPGLLTTRGPLIMASSPYARMGVLWETYKRHYGPDGAPSVLVAKGTTRDFNRPSRRAEIDRELERDRARNTAELLAEFRVIWKATFPWRWSKPASAATTKCPPSKSTTYYAFTDPSGGSQGQLHPRHRAPRR